VRYDVDDAVATLTLDRAERLNAVNAPMLEALRAALDRADGDDGVRAVIVTGADRAFCAGADLGGGGATFDRSPEGRGSFYPWWEPRAFR
jgi:enoyl-CoA hydratase/carnithine racemase